MVVVAVVLVVLLLVVLLLLLLLLLTRLPTPHQALAALLKPVAGPQGGAPCTIRATRPGQIEPMAVQAKLSKLTRTAHVELPGDPKHKSVMIGGTALQVTGGDETKVMTKKTVIEAQAATKSSTTHTSIEEGDVLGCLTVVEVGEEAKWLKEFPAGDKTITGAAKPLVANVQLGTTTLKDPCCEFLKQSLQLVLILE